MNSILLKDDKILNIQKSDDFMAKVILLAGISRMRIRRLRELSLFMPFMQVRRTSERAGKAIRIDWSPRPPGPNQPKLVQGPYNLDAAQAFHE